MITAILGLIGCGKSTLVSSLKWTEGYTVFIEPTSESEGAKNNPFLDLYYADPKRWAYTMQTFLLYERHKQFMEAYYRSLRGETCILDSCCESDMAFALVQKRDGYFTKAEFETYTSMYRTLRDGRQYPDLVLWLELKPEETLERINKRARNCEAGIPLEYLQHLYEAYQIILEELEHHTKVIRLDARASADEVFWNAQKAIYTYLN